MPECRANFNPCFFDGPSAAFYLYDPDHGVDICIPPDSKMSSCCLIKNSETVFSPPINHRFEAPSKKGLSSRNAQMPLAKDQRVAATIFQTIGAKEHDGMALAIVK